MESFFVILQKTQDYNIDIAERNGAERAVLWKIWRIEHGSRDCALVARLRAGTPVAQRSLKQRSNFDAHPELPGPADCACDGARKCG